MALKFNPFTGNFDFAGGGGGGIAEAVETFADLPETLGVPPIDTVYLVRKDSGSWNPFGTKRLAGLYIRSANTGVRSDDWSYLGAYPDVFFDDAFALVNATTPSKEAAFDLSEISASAKRIYKLPDKNGTVALDSEVRFDASGSYTYTGQAAPGASESSAVWFIRRSEFSSAGSYVGTTTANNVEWDNRLTASYS